MKKPITFSAILLKGLTSIIAQTLLIRELLIIFYGNELTFGIMLAIWLISGAIGSGLIGPLFKNYKNPVRPFCFFQILSSIWLVAAIILIRTSMSVLGIPFAEVFTIGQIAVISSLALSILASCDGALFSLGFRLVSLNTAKNESSVAKIYVLESLGIIIGGVSFTFLLLSIFNSFEIASLILILNCLCCSLLFLEDKNAFFKFCPWLFFLGALIFYPQSQALQKSTLKEQWKKKNIIAYENSVYGNIAVSKESGQFTIFYDGLAAISIPAPEAYFTEDFIHLALLTKPGAEKALFVGNAAGGLLREALKYPLKEVVNVELDPVFIKTIRSLKDPTTEKEIKDPRVRIVLLDGRSYIKSTKEKFDCIFVNAGLPTSLAINRYYTQEFFQEVKNTLTKDGIAIFKTWGSLSYLSEEVKKINASLLVTLEKVFAHVETIPGDGFNIFIASAKKPNLDIGFMAKNWKTLQLKTSLINPGYLALRLQQSYREWFDDNLMNEIKTAQVNRDLKPTGLYEGLSLYYSQFSKKLPKVFGVFKKAKTHFLITGIILFLILWRFLLKLFFLKRATLSFTVFTTGLFSMSAQIIVLFLFQSLLGYLFQWLAILTTSFMVGTSWGAYYVNRKLKVWGEFKKLGWVEIVLPTLTALFIFGTVSVFSNRMAPEASSKWLFSLVSICAGFLVGFEIPLIFDLYIKMLGSPDAKSQQTAGKLYCFDLIGACFGAIITPLILIPNCGILPATLILLLMKIGNGVNVLQMKEG